LAFADTTVSSVGSSRNTAWFVDWAITKEHARMLAAAMIRSLIMFPSSFNTRRPTVRNLWGDVTWL
jgi:hypothetical protein